MKNKILAHLDNPGQLERLYRSNSASFKKEFIALYPSIKDKPFSEFWIERLNHDTETISWGSKKELWFIGFACIVAGLLAKFPSIFSLNEEFYYPLNLGLIVFPLLIAFFSWKNKLSLKNKTIIGVIIAISAVFINLWPGEAESDTLILACIHLPLLLWVILGAAFTGNQINNHQKRLDFLRFNGDLVVMTAILAISGMLLSGITIGLFELIGLKIEQFYMQNVVIFGLPSIPIVATFLNYSNPHLVNKVSPIIAKIFSPVVLLMLIIYLGAIAFSGKNPYTDREFLLLFNLLLIGVMALIFFAVAESVQKVKTNFGIWVLLLLSIVTIIVNGIALSAIIFRISEWGFTPNRLAVLGSNILILIHLLMVTSILFKTVQQKSDVSNVGTVIAKYIPIYFIWTVVVVFIFPLIFGFN
ncbi:hypothetical protein [Fontibacter flavus]|uniref:DUF4153 domain-containing protein n=1 Tax=Fontibacter flavus TaxID=654838 RepID=A0ABV6FNX3_9BACT